MAWQTNHNHDDSFFRKKRRRENDIDCLFLFRSLYLFTFFLLLTFTTPFPLLSHSVDLKGLASTWAVISTEKSYSYQLGFRWLPDVSFECALNGEKSIEAELSFNAWAGATSNSGELSSYGQIKLYRAFGRFYSSRFEARLGLQRISFGSATFLRPMMWFDQLDPRDPLQITRGVYALLLRYYFLSNSNLWFWTLYGNVDPKGWELLPTEKKRPEFGGRWQIPLGKGEFGFCYHHRQSSLEQGNLASNTRASSSFENSKSNSARSIIPEDRIGLDGKWDLGPGVWFEAVFIWKKNNHLISNRQQAFTVGLDYTFSLGQGLYALAEYFEMRSGKKAWSGEDRTRFLAFSLSYPLSLIDNLLAVAFTDLQKKDTYFFFRWQRNYDRWNFNFMAFWNPENFQLYRQERVGPNLFAGKGFQFMLIFYY